MTTENAERLGQLADTIDNLIHALQLPLPDDLHLQGIRGSLPDVLEGLRAIYITETGENPWPKFTDDMTEEHLDLLSDMFIGCGDRYANFNTFWGCFLSEDPAPSEVSKVLKQIQSWGYVFDEDDDDSQ